MTDSALLYVYNVGSYHDSFTKKRIYMYKANKEVHVHIYNVCSYQVIKKNLNHIHISIHIYKYI